MFILWQVTHTIDVSIPYDLNKSGIHKNVYIVYTVTAYANVMNK